MHSGAAPLSQLAHAGAQAVNEGRSDAVAGMGKPLDR